MKTKFGFALLAISILTACRKNYVCTCVPETSPGYSITVADRSKAKAKANCGHHSVIPNGQEEIPVEKTICNLE